MKACILRKPASVERHPLEFTDVATPRPDRSEVLIQVRACGVCRTDLHVVEGELPVRRAPLIPGHQVIGIISALGDDVLPCSVGQLVGVAWLNRTCGECRFCRSDRENLCEDARFTGWNVDGGFAEYIVAPSQFTYQLPDGFDELHGAPLLCAGIIGFRALRLTGLSERRRGWMGARLGIYGFGAAGHVAIQLARSRGADVFVCTRDRERHQPLARELGAAWVGNARDKPPEKLDAAIIFAPAGELVPAALAALDKGGVLVLGGIHMSPVPSLSYELLYDERIIRSVANNTRADGAEFFEECVKFKLSTQIQVFPLNKANEALTALKNDAIRGAAVLDVAATVQS